MKKKRILTVSVVALLAIVMCFAVTACKKKQNGPAALEKTDAISIADYAVDYTQGLSGKAITGAADRNPEGTQAGSSGVLIKLSKQVSDETRYSVYNMSTGATIVSDVKTANLKTGNFYSVYYAYVEAWNNEGKEKVVMSDGTEILPYGEYDDYNLDLCTADTEAYYVKLTAVKGEGSNAVETVKYLKATMSKDGDLSYAVISESDVPAEKDIAVGDMIGLESVYRYPVTGEIAKYGYIEFGSRQGTKTYRFYKDGNKTGEVVIENGSMNGFVGNYMYYTTQTPVSPDAAEGYNMIVVEENDVMGYSSEMKYSVKQFRYDIVNNTTAELNYDTMAAYIMPLYNYKTKTCDAAIVYAQKSVGGIFVASENATKAYITDAELKLALDVTDVADSFEGNIQKLSENRYFLGGSHDGGVIVDENAKFVAKVDAEEKICPDQELIMFRYGNDYGFRDYDGKVVIAPKYQAATGGNIVFYGDWACVSRYDEQKSETVKVFLKKDGTERTAPENMTVGNGYYTYWEEKIANETTTYDFYVKSFDGTTIKSVTGLENQTGCSVNGEYVYLTDKDGKTSMFKFVRG